MKAFIEYFRFEWQKLGKIILLSFTAILVFSITAMLVNIRDMDYAGNTVRIFVPDENYTNYIDHTETGDCLIEVDNNIPVIVFTYPEDESFFDDENMIYINPESGVSNTRISQGQNEQMIKLTGLVTGNVTGLKANRVISINLKGPFSAKCMVLRNGKEIFRSKNWDSKMLDYYGEAERTGSLFTISANFHKDIISVIVLSAGFFALLFACTAFSSEKKAGSVLWIKMLPQKHMIYFAAKFFFPLILFFMIIAGFLLFCFVIFGILYAFSGIGIAKSFAVSGFLTRMVFSESNNMLFMAIGMQKINLVPVFFVLYSVYSLVSSFKPRLSLFINIAWTAVIILILTGIADILQYDIPQLPETDKLNVPLAAEYNRFMHLSPLIVISMTIISAGLFLASYQIYRRKQIG